MESSGGIEIMPFNKGRNEKLVIITVNVPETYLKYIKKLKEKGFVSSRSEYIRWSVANQINRDLEKLDKMDKMMAEIEDMRKIIKKDGWKDQYGNLKYVRIPNRLNGEELVKIVRRLD